MPEIHLHKIFEGMCKELQFILVGIILMGVGWYLPKSVSFIAFLLFVVGIILLVIGIGKSIEYAQR